MRDFLIFGVHLKNKPMGTFFIIIFIVFILFMIIGATAKVNPSIESFEATYKKSLSELILAGTYVSGHPLLDNSLKDIRLLLDENSVKIFTLIITTVTLKADIPKDSITNVSMEDASTIQNRVTVGRLLLTGIFAFAWKKKTKQECAYLVIEWKQGQFNNETIFEFEGTGSIQKANTIRNKFINYLSDSPDTNNNFDKELREILTYQNKLAAINKCISDKGMSIPDATRYVENLK